MGPDHVWLVSKDPFVVFFVQDMQNSEKSFKSDELAADVETTVPYFWNSKTNPSVTSPTTTTTERKLDMNAISQMVRWFQGQKNVFVFRIHIFRGTAPKSKHHTFQAGKTKYNQRTLIGKKTETTNKRMETS